MLFKLKAPPSIGTRGESRGATQVKRYLTKISLCDATGKGASVTLSGTPHCQQRAVIPLLYNGSCRIGLLIPDRGKPCPYVFARSTRRSIRLLRFCLAFRTSAWLSGNRFEVYSSSSAYLFYCWAVFYDGGERLSRGRNIIEQGLIKPIQGK